jgi:hypothetical protein
VEGKAHFFAWAPPRQKKAEEQKKAAQIKNNFPLFFMLTLYIE